MARKYKFRSETAHNFDVHPELEGQIIRFDKLKVGKENRLYAVVDTGERTTMVFHSKALEEMFNRGEPGDFVHIEFHGKKPLQGGKSFNKFSIELWTEDEGKEDDAETRSDK